MTTTYRNALNSYLDTYPLLIVIIMALVPRLIIIASPALFPQLLQFGGIGHDGYCEIAQNLVQHGMYSLDGVSPTFGRAPLFPLLLVPGALLRSVELWGMILNVVLGVLACAFIFLTGKLLGVSDRKSFLLSLFLVFNPWLIWMTKNGMTYVLTTFLLSLDYWLLGIIYTGNKRPHVYLILGITTALTALSHPVHLVLIMGIGLAIAIILRRQGLRLSNIAWFITLLCCGWVMTITPWTLRNYYLTKSFFPIVQGFGYQYLLSESRIKNLLTKGTFPWQQGGIINELSGIPIDSLSIKFSVVGDDHINKTLDIKAIEHIKTNIQDDSLYYVKHMMVNLMFLWLGDRYWGLIFLHLIYFISLISIIIIGTIKNHRIIEVAIILIVITPSVLVHCFMHAYIPHAAYCIPLTTGLILSAMVACNNNNINNFTNYYKL
jgi:4-amino-4-deoxy-L-arabinose transferase-like glycosyltransferase